MITKEFIQKYEKCYDYTEHDEEEYQHLLIIVPQEILNNNLSKETFIRVIDWKSPRPKGYINWDAFNSYQETFQNLESFNDTTRIKSLLQLPGIGLPVASVFLNIIWPDKYPIIDFRTVTVLYNFRYITWKTVPSGKSKKDIDYAINKYINFMEAIYKIRRDTNIISLRTIDRALFAYHKIK